MLYSFPSFINLQNSELMPQQPQTCPTRDLRGGGGVLDVF